MKSKHPLALAYNDKSPLENMHCVVLYEILRSDSTNIFANMSEAEWRESRKIILTIILGVHLFIKYSYYSILTNTLLNSIHMPPKINT